MGYQIDISGRYLLFSGDYYYPSGGMNDFCRSLDSLEKAMAEAEKLSGEDTWTHIFDRELGRIIDQF